MKFHGLKFIITIFFFFIISCSSKKQLEALGKIELAYISDRDVLRNVYLISNSNFYNPQMISNINQDETSAVWSPDGKKMAIGSTGVRNSTVIPFIDILDIETMESSTVMSDKRLFEDLAWSPIEKQILFSSGKVYDNEFYFDIFVMNLESLEMNNLTNSHSFDFSPVWSPDGSKIAFVSGRNGYTELFIMNADGTDQNSISTISQLPDEIAKCKSIYGPNAQNSSEEESEYYLELPYGCMLDDFPAWSPDGTKFAFVSARDGNLEIYIMNVDETELKNISNNPADDIDPSWSPDGSKIVFTSKRDSDFYQIYIMNDDGSDVIQITSGHGNKFEPEWRPQPAE